MKERKPRNYGQQDADNKIKRSGALEDGRRPAARSKTGRKKKKRPTNKEFARVTYAFVALFLLMMGYIVYFNLFKSQAMTSSPYNNKRQDIYASRVIRGKILDGGGNVLAETQTAEDGTETRVYPQGDIFAHVVGYTDEGKSGLESVSNFDLLTSNAFFVEKILNEFKGKKNTGDNLVTTLNSTLQAAAYDALGDNKGSVVVMEPSTGKILTMMSKPAYNPNTIADDWEALNADENGILVNRATQGAYAPGSTFKIATTLEFMKEQPGFAGYAYQCTGEITQDGTTIHCFNSTVHGDETLADSMAYSCNASYANIGLQLDPTKYAETTKKLLFNSKLPSELPYRESRFEIKAGATSAEMMMTAMGQGRTQVSPYHMALITSAVANGGKLMKPYLIDQVTNYAGATIKKTRTNVYTDMMTQAEAAQIKEYMKGVVQYGTATLFAGEDYSMAGKTGTAEYSSDKEKAHSWFVGFSNVDNPELAISVVVEGADESGVRATSIAKKVLDAYYYN